MPGSKPPMTDSTLVDGLRAFLAEACSKHKGPCKAIDPGHRVTFHWPPHPISHSFHILASDWRGKGRVEIHGEVFPVRVARTQHGSFGRIDSLWIEGRGDTEEAMYAALKKVAEPLFARQF